MVMKRERHFLPFLWTLSSSNHKTESTGRSLSIFNLPGIREQAGEKETYLGFVLALKVMFFFFFWREMEDSSFLFSYAHKER